ncbi:MAG: TonB-dependent receptor plug domain-containing protein, partial [Vicinamibacterales bacterium]
MKKARKPSRHSRPRADRAASHLFMAGALVASAALSPRLATPAHAATAGPSLKAVDAVARSAWNRASWEMELERFRRGGLPGIRRVAPMRLAQSPAQAQAARHTFNIQPGPLSDVLAAFEALTGLRTTVAEEGIRQLQSPGVTGTMTANEALARLLAGTGVRSQVNGNVVRLEIESRSEFIAVTGTAAPIVSTPKFTEPLRDIPQTVTVITNQVIQSQGVTTLRDVLRNVPGVTFQAGEGGGGLPGDTFTMRGFSSRNDIFIDGIRDAGGYSRDAFNLEQVEVIKGPSSSIAGRGATGGAINQVTKTPGLSDAQSASIGFGNSDFRRGTIDVNRPIEALGDAAAFRLNAMWTDSGVPGREVVENNSWGIAPALAFGLGRPTQVTLKYQHITQDNVPDYGLPWGTNYPGYATGAFQADPPVDQSNFYGLEDYDFEDVRSDVATIDLQHRFGNSMTLRNATRYSDTDRDSAITAPRPPNRQLQRRNMSNANVSNQTNPGLTFVQGAVQHDVSAGLELSRERTR